MNIYAQVPDNSEVEIVEKTENIFYASGNNSLSEIQFKHVWMSVGEQT
jgi:hypothetical protein